MKKIEYMTPEMEVVDLKYNQILCASDGGSQQGGLDDEYDDEDPA